MIKKTIFVVTLFIISFASFATQNNSIQQDTTIQELTENINSLNDFHSDYILNSELEHQKLIRNIFAFSFGAMLLLLGFVIFTYGKKIKKVSNVIGMQNEVLNSTKDQLIKIINIFNYLDRQVYITDSKGNIEWHNVFASKYFNEDFEKEKISLVAKFSTENQGVIFQGINDVKTVDFNDHSFNENSFWKMIPIKNSKDEFANMVFIGINN